MKRRLARICVLLVLGAIINIAVAWGCTIAFPAGNALVDNVEAMELFDQWVNIDISKYEFTDIQSSRKSALGWRSIILYRALVGTDLQSKIPRNDTVQLFVQKAGLPLTCLECGFGSPPVIATGDLGIPESLIRYPNELRVLPTRPNWPGFAFNTLFYAAIPWCLFAAPFALRRRRRIKRGLCSKCAYDLRGTSSETCPECGEVRADR